MAKRIYNYHYIYRITNIIENKYYYGSRSCNILPQNDLGFKYFSSSKDKEFILDQKTNPQNYTYKIICLCETRQKALDLEVKLHEKFDVGVNPNFYNRAKQTSVGFSTIGVSYNTGKKWSAETREKMKNKKVSQEQKDKNSIFHKNKVVVRDIDGKCFKVDKNDPRYISGELVPASRGVKPANTEKLKGFIQTKDKDGNVFRVKKDDPRWISGELIGIRNGSTRLKNLGGKSIVQIDKDTGYVLNTYITIREAERILNLPTIKLKNKTYSTD